MQTTYYRVAAVIAAAALSSLQFRYFDCNKMRTLSFISGVATLLIVYGVGEALWRLHSSRNPDRAGLLNAAGVLAIGVGLLVAAGFFTLVTHMCP